MNKIEASFIKRLLRINTQTFVGLVLEISQYSLFLILLDTYSFLGSLLEGVAQLVFWSKKEKEE